MPISAVDTITLAFQHAKQQLTQPFRVGQWTRLAFVGFLAGELGSGGGCNFSKGLNLPQHPPSPRHFLAPQLSDLGIDPAALAGLIAVLIVGAVVFGIVMLYISSVMRFILFDSVLTKQCRILQGWSRRQGEGWRYFLWQIGFAVVTFGAAVILIGIPAAFAFALGWFNTPREHVAGLVLGGIFLFFVIVFLVVTTALVHVFTKDFVVPQMALEGIGAIEGWRRLWPMVQAEMGGYTVYVLMKVILAIAAGIIIGIASIILGLLVAIPTIGISLVALITGKSAGLTWNVYTITVAIVVGAVLLGLFLYLVSLISVPAIVFFPAYSMYFFAARYRPLSVALCPPAETPPPQLIPAPTG